MAYQPTEWEHGDIITGGKLNKIEQELTHVSDNASYGFGGAQLSSDGLTPLSYINAGDPMPSNPQKGDTVFLKDGNDFLIYSYNGEDWVLRVDPDLSNRIEDTIKTASDNTDKAIADNNTQINETINQVAKAQADLAVKDGDFNNKAQAMADKALQDAKDNTATVAKSTLDTANQNIADAKKSVSDDIAKEVSDRATAVSDLDTKAQGYADTAKKNAIDVATTADGVINKKIDDTASSITSTVSQNKKDADGKISTAQSTATQALNGLSSKVDTATYNAKTGQLSTDVTNVAQTANQAKTDIASIKQTDTTQDARMTTIEADANGTKTTVSNLQTVQGQQTGSISALQQRADGFDATVTKVNNLSVGGRNYVLNTNVSTTSTITGFYSSVPSSYFNNKKLTVSVQLDYDNITALSGQKRLGVEFVILNKDGSNRYVGSWKYPAIGDSFHGRIYTTWDFSNNEFKDYATNQMYQGIYVQGITGTNVSVSKPKLEIGTSSTDWTPAPEDVDSATAKAQLTADQATTSLNNYKTDADGRITKAQSDITQTAKDVTTKVSQTDYNAKTGDLDTRVTKAQTTADGVATTVGAYKTSNDNRVKATETSIAQNTKDITLRATTADLDSAKNDYNTQIAQVSVGVDKINTYISNQSASAIRYIRLRANGNTDNKYTHFSEIKVYDGRKNELLKGLTPTAIGGATFYNNSASKATDGDYTTYMDLNDMGNQEKYVMYDLGSAIYDLDYMEVSMFSATRTYLGVTVQTSYDGISWNTLFKGAVDKTLLINNVVSARIPFGNNLAQLASQQITIDGITDTVSKQGTNIDSVTKRVTTAEGTLSTATNNISSLQTSVTQTANQLKQEVTDRTTGDSNTLQSSKDFTTSSITSAVNGVNSTITQTSDSLIAKINTKTDSDTVLSLLKNNWSIGITDNISKITSGIVGNASQMSLISKNVTIDSPNTQIKGTAWINSAMIANGAIGNAQISDATITSAKIATLDVAKLTGNVSNFIQSNWNGLYQSVKISPIGMTISTSQGSTAQFNQDGLMLQGSLGQTNVLNGQIELISSANEYLGTFQHETMPDHSNVDYLMIKLAGWHTSNPGDSDYDINSAGTNTIRGGDGIGFGVTNSTGTYDMKMSWDSSLIAGYKSRKSGWHVEDLMTWHQTGYFENGLDVSQNFGGSDQRAFHAQGATLSNGHKWYGFFDTPSQAGFGMDDTRDVIFYVKGKSYSLYTMLSKLSML